MLAGAAPTFVPMPATGGLAVRDESNTSGTSFTFAGMSLGPAVSGKYIILALATFGASTPPVPDSVTVDGHAATLLASAGDGSVGVQFWGVMLDTAVTGGDIVVHFTATCQAIECLVNYGLHLKRPGVLIDQQSDAASPFSVTLALEPGCIFLALYAGLGSANRTVDMPAIGGAGSGSGPVAASGSPYRDFGFGISTLPEPSSTSSFTIDCTLSGSKTRNVLLAISMK